MHSPTPLDLPVDDAVIYQLREPFARFKSAWVKFAENYYKPSEVQYLQIFANTCRTELLSSLYRISPSAAISYILCVPLIGAEVEFMVEAGMGIGER